MLSSLHIRNYILIDSLDISFPEGLIIITGQTGAGKSILLGALSLLSGAKADASMISAGKDSCVVEAEFMAESYELGQILSEEDIEFEENGSLLIRRVISSSGRSRCFINDCPVSQTLLQNISAYLVDIHSQHSSLLLGDKAFQLSVLDNYASNAGTLEACRILWKQLQSKKLELEELRSALSRLESDRDYDAAMLQQLEDARLKEGELEELEEEQKSLANAEQIKEALSAACGLLSPESEGMGVSVSIKEAIRNLEHISRYLSSSSAIVERLESARIELDDLVSEIETLSERVEISPERLEAVEDRMSLLYGLMKKHSVMSVSELIVKRDEYREKLVDSSTVEEKIQVLEKEIASLESEWKKNSDALHDSRAAAAPKLAESILSDLHFLELEQSDFVIELSGTKPGANGYDKVEFLFSSTGQKPVNVAKVASGGELSRIMLCLKAAMAKFMGMPTMVFDEIDTGVSGSVADKIGQMICSMGESMQLLSITHLPQVAAKGEAHYVVEKSTDSLGKTTSGLRRVEGEQRINEIARLLSGATISEAALANARTLLEESGRKV